MRGMEVARMSPESSEEFGRLDISKVDKFSSMALKLVLNMTWLG